MSRIRKLLSSVATQTAISVPSSSTTHNPGSCIPPPTEIVEFPISAISTTGDPGLRNPAQLSSPRKKSFTSLSTPAIMIRLRKSYINASAPSLTSIRNIHSFNKCSCCCRNTLPKLCKCQFSLPANSTNNFVSISPLSTSISSMNAHGHGHGGGVNVKGNSEVPRLSKLSRVGPCETLTSKTPTLARSVVTSQKVAEIGRRDVMDEPKLMSKEEREAFNSIFPELIRELTEISEYRDMPDTNRWLARVMQYNVPHGKRNRGLATALAYRYLAHELTEENVKLSHVLGWCVELLQAYFLVSDDIMDGSETRRGRLCWYKMDNLGISGFNDALLLESAVFMLLKKYFGKKEYYTELVDIMHDVNHKTIYGQSLDTQTGLQKKLETYNMDRYSAIVKYKTSFYSFYLPVRLAMTMAGITDQDVLQQVRTVTLEMGHFFQVQDDYLDCFGDIEVTGKVGTDIQDSKCSWLFVVASQKCTPQQKAVLWENYGDSDPSKIDRVKKLYLELDLPETYNMYEEQTYNLICTHIRQMSDKLPKQLFFDMVNKIYRRSQ